MTSGEARPANSAFSVFLVLTVLYVGALLVLDDRLVLSRLAEMAMALPVLVVCGLSGMALRFVRWQLLLARFHRPVIWRQALPAYAAGFAFTATPGKVGELVRVRYFDRLAVPQAAVVACFVTERAIDLLVIFTVATSIATHIPGFAAAALFVLLVLAAIVAMGQFAAPRRWLQYHFRRRGLRLPARLIRTLLGGIERVRRSLTARDLVIAGGLGVAAWSCHLAGFAIAFSLLGIRLDPMLLVAIPAAAMLVGAASMLPGGIGATETAMVVLLTAFGVPLNLAALGAVTIRLGSIWVSMLLGLAAVAWLERRRP